MATIKAYTDLEQSKKLAEILPLESADIKEELSKLFQEFMLDCIKDDTETHILHFVDVFKNKLKEIGNE